MSDFEDSMKLKGKMKIKTRPASIQTGTVKVKEEEDPLKRHVTRWDMKTDQLILLSLVHVFKKSGVKIPWDEVAIFANPKGTGAAIEQHIGKIYKRRLEAGELVPPPTPRGHKRALNEVPATPTKVNESAKTSAKRTPTKSSASKLDTPKSTPTKPTLRTNKKKPAYTEEEVDSDASYVETPSRKGTKLDHKGRKKPITVEREDAEDDDYLPESPTKKPKMDHDIKNEADDSDNEEETEVKEEEAGESDENIATDDNEIDDAEDDDTTMTTTKQKDTLIVTLPLPPNAYKFLSEASDTDASDEDPGDDEKDQSGEGIGPHLGQVSTSTHNRQLSPTEGYGPIINNDQQYGRTITTTTLENPFDPQMGGFVQTPQADNFQLGMPAEFTQLGAQFQHDFNSGYNQNMTTNTEFQAFKNGAFNNDSLNISNFNSTNANNLNYDAINYSYAPDQLNESSADVSMSQHQMQEGYGTYESSFDSFVSSFYPTSANSIDGSFAQLNVGDLLQDFDEPSAAEDLNKYYEY